jgi:allophanate hydrolase
MITVESLRAQYAAGRSPVDVVDEVLARIAASGDPAAWIARREAGAVRAEAAALRAEDRERLPLWGVPFAVKDNIDVAGIDTTAACPPFAYRPAADATAVARLRAAGAVVIGKTNLDQFATGLVGVRSPYGIPRCVFDPAYVSGGSSSGSAVAVARGEVAFALGTDTAGSGRVPAAFNHVVGVKPTRGLIGAGGVVPACQSLDVVSVFAASCAEADLVRRAAQGVDPRDPYARPARPRPLPLAGLRVGVLAAADRDFEGDELAAAQYARAVATAATLWTTREFDYAPFRDTGALLYDGPWLAERHLALADALARHGDAVNATVRALVEPAARRTAADAFHGLHRRAALAQRAAAVWEAVDVLLLPTAPTHPRVDAVLADPIRGNAVLGRYTNFVNLLDYCAVAIPAGFRPDGLPFGVTLVAPAFADDDLAVAADRLHRALAPTTGLARAPLPAATPSGHRDAAGVRLAVVGAHLAGLPLNHQLVERDAVLVARTRTAPAYRLYALPGTTPPRPGLVRDPGPGSAAIEVEVWQLSAAALGSFVAEVPPPLAIGTVLLADGSHVKGFVCEPTAIAGAEEITAFGGWRAYLDAR